MKITMLYFHTVAELIKKYGYTWEEVNKIKDFKGRVIFNEYEYTLESAFYSTHMGRTMPFGENGERDTILTKAFIKALQDVRDAG